MDLIGMREHVAEVRAELAAELGPRRAAAGRGYWRRTLDALDALAAAIDGGGLLRMCQAYNRARERAHAASLWASSCRSAGTRAYRQLWEDYRAAARTLAALAPADGPAHYDGAQAARREWLRNGAL